MDATQKRTVKVRINASGQRVIGILVIPPPHFRTSDYLNSRNDFLLVKQEKTDTAIAKDTISYLETLEESGDTGSRPKEGAFHQVTFTMKRLVGVLEGEMFVAEGGDFLGTLNLTRRFINLRNVRFQKSPEQYDFIAVGKKEILMVQEVARPG